MVAACLSDNFTAEKYERPQLTRVAPHTGAWIETAVEDFRIRFKKFLSVNNIPSDIMIEIRKSGAGTFFYERFNISIGE